MNYKKNRFQTLSLSPIRYKTLVCVLYTWYIAKGRERIGREREEEGMKWVWGRRYQLPIDARHTHARRHTPGEEDEKKRRKKEKRTFSSSLRAFSLGGIDGSSHIPSLFSQLLRWVPVCLSIFRTHLCPRHSAIHFAVLPNRKRMK